MNKLSLNIITVVAAAGMLLGACEKGPDDTNGVVGSGEPTLTEALPVCSTTHLNAEGNLSSKTIYTFDAMGHVVGESHDTNGDGVADETIVLIYNTIGKIEQRLEDRDADGTDDVITTFEYDFGGVLSRESVDRNADGTADAETIYEHDGFGNLRWSEYDANLDGVVDERHEFNFDHHNRLSEERVYTAGRTEPDRIITYTYDYDDKLISKLEKRQTAEFSSIFETSYEYDAVGNVLSESIDFGADGEPDQVIAYSYADELRLQRKELDRGVDGDVDETVELEYDADGFLATQIIDSDGDGNVDSKVTYDYSCWE